MAASYPGTIRYFTTKSDYTDVVEAGDVDALQDEVIAIQTVLGTHPSGDYATVGAWLAALADTAVTNGSQTFGGSKTWTGDQHYQGHVYAEYASASISDPPISIGDLAALWLALDHSGIQAFNGSAPAALQLNPLGGEVHAPGPLVVDDSLTAAAATIAGAVSAGSTTVSGKTTTAALQVASALRVNDGSGIDVSSYVPVHVVGAGPMLELRDTTAGVAKPRKFLKSYNGAFVLYADDGATALMAVDDAGNVFAKGTFVATSRTHARTTVWQTTSLSVDHNVWTDFSPNAVVSINTHNDFSTPFYQNGQWFSVAPNGGSYSFTVRVTWAHNVVGLRGIRIITQGGTVLDQDVRQVSAMPYDYMASGSTFNIPPPTYWWKVQLLQTSGAPLSVMPYAPSSPTAIDATLVAA